MTADETPLPPEAARAAFERAVLPHLSAAYNLARWLTKNGPDAEDVVQEAVLRALRFFRGFRGADGRAWLLTIVRNTFYSRMSRTASGEASFDEAEHGAVDPDDPETLLLKSADRDLVRLALEELPAEFREVLVLRELEGLSYREIAAIVSAPQGTVMSRLARGRRRLQERLAPGKREVRRDV